MSSNAPATVPCDVKDLALAPQGKRRIEWAFHSMPVLQTIRKQFIKAQPLEGAVVAACLKLSAESANLLVTLRDSGAKVVVCASDPLAIQDDVAASLVRDYSIPVFAVSGESEELRTQHLTSVLALEPTVGLEDTGVLAFHRAPLSGIVEQAAAGSGVARSVAKTGALSCPVIAAHQSSVRRLFDNRYGTGQSAIDAIVRATNLLIAGMTVVVAGFGSCGRGIASRARGLGANVVVTEVEPERALDAVLEGHRVMSMAEAARIGDLFITVAGIKTVIGRDHFERLKDGAILSNAGHSSCEIDIETLGKLSTARKEVREAVEEFKMKDGRRVYVLCGGRTINRDGHPATVSDIGYGTEALAIDHLLKNRSSLENQVYPLPESIDRQAGRMKLDAMGVTIDKLTIEQEEFRSMWSEGY